MPRDLDGAREGRGKGQDEAVSFERREVVVRNIDGQIGFNVQRRRCGGCL